MKIAVSHSRKDNPAQAAKEAFERLTAKMAVPIHMLLVYYTEALDPGIIAGTLSELAPNVPIHGGSTSQGILTDAGFIAGRPGALGLLGIFDPDGQYGTAFCDYAEGAYQAGVSAIQKSLQNAGRPGESPLLVWMTATPGKEEEVIAGIQSVVGPHVTILGGTAADDTISGNWSIIGNSETGQEGVVLSAFFPSTEPGFSFHSGYSPTRHGGLVTRAHDRILHEIDNRPAAEVYDEWTGGVVSAALTKGENILRVTNHFPLARVTHRLGRVPLYLLSHPERILPDASIALFTDIRTNEHVSLMIGNRASLVQRPVRVIQSILENNDYKLEQIQGALIVFCAGSMLAVQNDLGRVHRMMQALLPGVPFLTIFTFGEQGFLHGGDNYHGNLMISAMLFSDEPSAL